MEESEQMECDTTSPIDPEWVNISYILKVDMTHSRLFSLAEKYKAEGNAAYKNKEYEKACEMYSTAIRKCVWACVVCERRREGGRERQVEYDYLWFTHRPQS